ncbi:DNA-binding response regulator [bacterium C-53]|nr:DNA-binding response regulator [Lachnospiraceae bacterium]NBI04706.1 DNA-binding response regulator [Lachnospiraceae bacterium]RKJ07852.1 DNA-binding response regulator [bacterium C-53]
MNEYNRNHNWVNENPLTIIDIGALHFCLEYRSVEIQGQEIELTAKEFDILALLILNPRRVFTYEMISDIVWKEEYNEYSRKAINNHISNLRRKLKTTPDIPNYIKSVHSVGYKFEPQE